MSLNIQKIKRSGKREREREREGGDLMRRKLINREKCMNVNANVCFMEK